jgi:peptidyl-prolyl cis-trans isomerase B (cyclophilin B)
MGNSSAMKALNLICTISLIAGMTTALAGEVTTNSQVATSAPKADDTNDVAVINTTDGEMVVAFWPEVAPNTVANFEKLAKSGFYDGTCFHRIMKGFMIQGGDPLTKDPSKKAEYGTGGPGYTIKAEFNRRPHETGVISMARSNDPDSAGSQFFICDAPADNPRMQYLDGKYTAFGKLIKGTDVLKKIADTPVEPNPYYPRHENSWPTTRVDIISIKIVPADSVK